MNQQIHQTHETDKEGCPTGGTTTGVGIEIHWQNGSLGRGEDRKDQNGAFVEGVLSAVLGRLEYYENSKFEDIHNRVAIIKIKEALVQLEERTKERETRQIEGTHTV